VNFRLLKSGFSAAIYTGLHNPNVLAVVAQGNMLNVYVNHQHLASVTDTTYIAGRIGTAIGSTNGSSSDGAFNNLMLWAL
jgi:D-aminopeptidase